MKSSRKFVDCVKEVEDRIVELVAELEQVEIRVGELKTELKGMVKALKSRRSGMKSRKNEDKGEKTQRGENIPGILVMWSS